MKRLSLLINLIILSAWLAACGTAATPSPAPTAQQATSAPISPTAAPQTTSAQSNPTVAPTAPQSAAPSANPPDSVDHGRAACTAGRRELAGWCARHSRFLRNTAAKKPSVSWRCGKSFKKCPAW